MIITLSGENSFELQNELGKLTEGFVSKYGDLAIERIDCQETDIAQISQVLSSLPFLAERKMVVLRAPSTNKQFTEQVEQILSDISELSDVVLVEPKLDKRLSYYKYLKNETDFHEFLEYDFDKIVSWVVARTKAKNGTISLSDARYFAERLGINQLLLDSELEKLLLYDSNISRQSIELLTEPSPRSTIFQLLEAAFNGDSKRALTLYQEQRALKVDPSQIIAMLSWQLNVLAIILTSGGLSSQEIAREANLKPFVVQKSQALSRKLSTQSLRRLIKDLLDIDVASKSTNIDVDEALEHYILKLAV